MRCHMRISLLLLAASTLTACAAGDGSRRKPRNPAPLLVASGTIAEGAPVLRVQGTDLPHAEHRVSLQHQQPVRVTATSADEDFDPILECRPVDGVPDETLRNDDARGLGNGAQVELLPTRDGPWILSVGDARGRRGTYRLEVVPILEREVLRALGTAPASVTGTEAPATFFCPIVAGRRYRIAVAAEGFPPHLALAAPGSEQAASNECSIEFTAARSGQAVVRVASLSLASGSFALTVTELW